MFAVAFVAEKGQPVGRPRWVATGVRKSRYGADWKVTTEPEQAATWAKRETAEQWAGLLTSPGAYEFAAVEAPEAMTAGPWEEEA